MFQPKLPFYPFSKKLNFPRFYRDHRFGIGYGTRCLGFYSLNRDYMVVGTGIGSQQIRDRKAPCENLQGYEIPISLTLQKSEWCANNFAWVAKFLHTLRNFRNPHAKSTSSTSDDHNFLVRTPIRVFLDSMEISLSLKSNHILVNGILRSQIWDFYALFKELC